MKLLVFAIPCYVKGVLFRQAQTWINKSREPWLNCSQPSIRFNFGGVAAEIFIFLGKDQIALSEVRDAAR